MSKSTKVKDRQWLNTYQSQARSMISINYSDEHFEGNWAISDCHKTIELDFGVWPHTYAFTVAESKKALKHIKGRKEKLERMQKHLDLMLESLLLFEDKYKAAIPELLKKGKENAAERKKRRIRSLEELMNEDEQGN